ncbi:MAG: DNA-binding domain-containing protein [Robiginitomaculum sp.]|nr:DNA-binding domain-containing protein [Robiginitomaculum sp.]MDQ7076529.1 DNA-binding domain-containing protein [Robiginitomaculum sp.]
MAEDREFYDRFANVLGGGDADAMTPWLKQHDHVERLGIHKSNFRITTTKAMQGIYKAVNRLVGEEYFAALMTAFLKENPPTFASLTHYGAGFADFLRNFAPVQKDLSWLAPVARLDWAWFIAYGAANASALVADELQGMAPEVLPALAPGLHVSARLLRFSVPAYSIWRTNIEDENVRKIDLKAGREWALIWRQDMHIRHASLTRAQYVFLDAIGGGHSLAQGWTDAMGYDPAFDLTREFAHWLSAGVFNGENDDQ